jgi:sugar O-acyltransferase (sialic acid O-acetyltransferase NeuD family)
MTKLPDEIYVVGAGGHGKVAVRAAQLCEIHVVGVFDDDPTKVGRDVCGVPVMGYVRWLSLHRPLPTLIAIGDNARRLSLANELKMSWATLVHPAAMVDSYAQIGAGALILAGAVVQVDATIGDHAVVNDNATVEHDCYVGPGAHVSCNACLAGAARVGKGAMVGAGAVILPNVHVGDFATIGAGAVVTRDVPSYATAVGVPARILPFDPTRDDRSACRESMSLHNAACDTAFLH